MANSNFTSEELLECLKKGIYKMLVVKAKDNGDIVVSDDEGNPIIIKAKDALKDWDKEKYGSK